MYEKVGCLRLELVVYMHTCTGSDADEAGDHSLDGSDHGRLLEEDDVEARPHQEAGGGADVSVEHRQGGVDVGGVGVAAVEPRPTHPQQPGSRQHQQHVVGRKPLPVLGGPRPDLMNLDQPALTLSPRKIQLGSGEDEPSRRR
ncbi:hypothetical protein C4D60_Mb05t27710 [Musa balbisiana]|uniref:Uncharacterized protein n=1 Tax=Musa balbisiana TaxID=52838 RepID=A0A4S8JZD6_MUSBA|nr:hypothetical protein C4D60_Mb05t27710 [Musa balbisiana]